MHLTDEQLLEMTDLSMQHLSACRSCSARASNLKNIRQSLHQLNKQRLPISTWQAIQREAKARQQHNQITSIRKEMKDWKLTSFALVASIVAIFFWPIGKSFNPIEQSLNEEITHLIQQNKQLQQQLIDLSIRQRKNNVSFQLLQLDVLSMDSSIQRAYMDQTTSKQKLTLWRKRKQLIRRMLLINNDIQKIAI